MICVFVGLMFGRKFGIFGSIQIINVLLALSGFTIVITSLWPYLQKVCMTLNFFKLRGSAFIVQMQMHGQQEDKE